MEMMTDYYFDEKNVCVPYGFRVTLCENDAMTPIFSVIQLNLWRSLRERIEIITTDILLRSDLSKGQT